MRLSADAIVNSNDDFSQEISGEAAQSARALSFLVVYLFMLQENLISISRSDRGKSARPISLMGGPRSQSSGAEWWPEEFGLTWLRHGSLRRSPICARKA